MAASWRRTSGTELPPATPWSQFRMLVERVLRIQMPHITAEPRPLPVYDGPVSEFQRALKFTCLELHVSQIQRLLDSTSLKFTSLKFDVPLNSTRLTRG